MTDIENVHLKPVLTDQDHVVARHPLPVAGILALVTLPIQAVLPMELSMQFAAGILALIAGIYIGFAVLDGRLSRLAIETFVALLFSIFAITALAINPVWLAAGYIAHGIWDALHHTPLFDVEFPRWYIPMCAAYDVLAGIGLLVIWSLK